MRILIHTFAPGHIGVLASLIKELEKNHTLFYTQWDKEHTWTTGEENSWTPYFQNMEPFPENIDCTIMCSSPSAWKQEFPRPVIYLPHGSQICAKGYTAPMDKKIDLIFVQGQLHYDLAKEIPDANKQVLTGWPKIDELTKVDDGSIRKSVINELGLDPVKPIIVFAPTSEIPKRYSETCKDDPRYVGYPGLQFPNSTGYLAPYIYEQLKDDYNVIFCPHELDHWKKHMKDLPNVVCPQGFNGETPNKNRYLIASDLLIGDRSSIMHEYLATLKPQIHLWNELDKDNFPLHILADPSRESVAFGPRISAREVKKYVDVLIANPALYLELRKYWLNRIFYKPGTATQRFVQELEKFVIEWKNK